jgi:hypothetical protein
VYLQVFCVKEAPVMCQAEDDGCHRDAPFQEPAGGVEQPQAGQQPSPQRPILGIFSMDLTRLRGHQLRQRAAVGLTPTPSLPGPEQTGRRAGRRLTAQVGAGLVGFLHDDHRDRPERGAGGGEPPIPSPRELEAVTPRPLGPSQQVLAGDPPSVGPLAARGARALHPHPPMLVVRDVPQQLRVATPTIGHDQGGGRTNPSRGRAG